MVNKPFFSIVIATYNRASDLQFALYCILRQNFLDFEIIISDDCSTDNTKDIINKFDVKKIHYYKNKENIGGVLNYKKAIKHAGGKYVFLHGDDDFLLYKNSLEEIHNKIVKYNPGHIRVNYICLSPDKKRIFDFKANKSFIKDQYLSPFSENKEVIQFILDSDSAFVSGIIFKNSLPNHIEIFDTFLVPSIQVLFYVGKNYGAYFIKESQIIASWSKWATNKKGHHVLYSLIDGKLASERYLNAVKRKLKPEIYSAFLHNQLMGIYVRRFPLVKLSVGSKNLLRLAARMRFLDPKITKSIAYWTYLILTLITPEIIIKITKEIYLYAYIRFSGVKNNKQIIMSLKNLKHDYIHFLGDLKPIINS